MHNNLPERHNAQTLKRMRQESTVITKCLAPECTGFYIDSISEYFLIKCLDPKHSNDEAMGPDKPTAEDDTDTQRSDQLRLEVRSENV
jgi:hypothetical protein